MTSPELTTLNDFYDIYDLMKSYDFFRVPTLTHAYFYNYHDLGHFSLVLAEL